MAKVMSEKAKYRLADELGFGERAADGDWSDVTTGEIGSMVREAIKRGSEAVAAENSDSSLTNKTEQKSVK